MSDSGKRRTFGARASTKHGLVHVYERTVNERESERMGN
jgi:hypothetical protein